MREQKYKDFYINNAHVFTKKTHAASDNTLRIKTRINQLKKQVKEKLGVELQASWEKFCNSVSLETDPGESWRKINNFLKPKGRRDS